MTYQRTKFIMLKHVSKYPAVAAVRFPGSLGLVCVFLCLLSADVNVAARAGTDMYIIYETLLRGIQVRKSNRHCSMFHIDD